MSVSASPIDTSSALGALTNSGTQLVQQKIAVKVVMDQMEEAAAMTTKLVESDNSLSQSNGIGTRVDFRA